jgi:hypothetical protein
VTGLHSSARVQGASYTAAKQLKPGPHHASIAIALLK